MTLQATRGAAAAVRLIVVIWAANPSWAATMLAVVVCIGAASLAAGVVLARRHDEQDTGESTEHPGRLREIVTTLRQGLGVLRQPRQALIATAFEAAGWFCQLLAVWATMRAFHLSRLPLVTAALVLVLMNVANLIPL